MNNYEKLLDEAASDNIKVVENYDFKSGCLGMAAGRKIGLSRKIETQKEKACILAEELGHHKTTAGEIFDQNIAVNRKQEHHARFWGYNRMIGLNGIVQAHQNRRYTLVEIAEYLDVPEQFLIEALECYRKKYGKYVQIDNYVIYFEPTIGVFELMK